MGEFLQALLQWVGFGALVIGVIFCAIAVLGLFRLPDVYTRLHASAKVTTMGLAGLLLGAALIMPSTAPKAIALTIFMVITSPVSTHAIAMAAYRSRVPMVSRPGQKARDDLGEHLQSTLTNGEKTIFDV